MAEFDDAAVDRRGFLKGAAAFVAEPQPAGAPDAAQDHTRQVVPSDVALWVKAIESLLVDKGSSIAPPSTSSSTPSKPKSARATARALSRAPGSIPPTRHVCCATQPRQSRKSASPAIRAWT